MFGIMVIRVMGVRLYKREIGNLLNKEVANLLFSLLISKYNIAKKAIFFHYRHDQLFSYKIRNQITKTISCFNFLIFSIVRSKYLTPSKIIPLTSFRIYQDLIDMLLEQQYHFMKSKHHSCQFLHPYR